MVASGNTTKSGVVQKLPLPKNLKRFNKDYGLKLGSLKLKNPRNNLRFYIWYYIFDIENPDKVLLSVQKHVQDKWERWKQLNPDNAHPASHKLLNQSLFFKKNSQNCQLSFYLLIFILSIPILTIPILFNKFDNNFLFFFCRVKNFPADFRFYFEQQRQLQSRFRREWNACKCPS